MTDEIFIYPTDTVWGIGTSIYSEHSVKEIARIKGTDPNKPTSIMFSNLRELRDYFDLPSCVTDQWLEVLFHHEASLALPLKYAKRTIPKYVTGDSEFVSTRIAINSDIVGIINKTGSPITTTSFNRTHEPPLRDLSDVKKLMAEIAPHCTLVPSLAPLSGNSSTMMVLHGDCSVSFWRKGTFGEFLEEHGRLLTT